MFLKSRDELVALLKEEKATAVVLNQTSTHSEDDAIPLSNVLEQVLEGKTRSFSVLVGFFGHRGGVKEQEKSIAQSIVDKATSAALDVDPTTERASFRLAVGVNSSKAAQDASRAWYWLCRYRM